MLTICGDCRLSLRTAMTKKNLKPVHPGEVLLEEFLKPKALTQSRLALDIGVSSRRINEIVARKRSITADTALRLGRYFQMSPQFWLGLQMDYDLDVAARCACQSFGSRGQMVSFGRLISPKAAVKLIIRPGRRRGLLQTDSQIQQRCFFIRTVINVLIGIDRIIKARVVYPLDAFPQ